MKRRNAFLMSLLPKINVICDYYFPYAPISMAYWILTKRFLVA